MRVDTAGRLIFALGFGVIIVLGGCESDPTQPEPPDPGSTLSVDATHETDWALVALANPAQLVGSGSPESVTGWDLGFRTTSVIVNGGDSGPGGVVAYCVCQNAGTTDAELMEFTAEGEKADFEAVTSAQIPPAGAAWSADAFDQNRWYRYNLTGEDRQIWPTFDVYLVKRGTAVYKIQITSYYAANGDARHVTFRYAKLVD